jgi:hypothetical protein
MKYLYAGHVYAWGAEQLSYYISFLGGARAIFLLFLLPCKLFSFDVRWLLIMDVALQLLLQR